MKDKCKIIAEIAQAHDGSLGILHSYIDAAADCGVDAVKFQTHIAEAESSIFEPFRVNFSYEDKTRFDYWNRMSFTKNQWAGIYEHCEKRGVEFISSPFSNAAVDLLECLPIQTYKIGSGEVTNKLLLEKIARTGKKILLSSGMNSYEDIYEALKVINRYHEDVVIFQCTSSYPVPVEMLGINVIDELKDRFMLPVGFSDHSGEIYAGLYAASKGIDYYEGHIVFNKNMFGPDAKSSLDLEQFSDLVKGIRYIDTAIENPINKDNIEPFKDIKNIFEKSLCLNKDMKKGNIITFDDLEAKKPSGYGYPASNFESVLGKRITREMKKWEFLKESDFE